MAQALAHRPGRRCKDGDRIYHQMAFAQAGSAITHVVRVRETQEYDVEVVTSSDSRDAARLARLRFLGMTVVEQASNSVGVTSRTFEVGEDDFDEDELAGDA
jgi:hypothetical protein